MNILIGEKGKKEKKEKQKYHFNEIVSKIILT